MRADTINTPLLPFDHLLPADQAQALLDRGVHLFDWPIGAYLCRFYALDTYFVLARLDERSDDLLVQSFPGHGPLFDAMLQAMEDLGLAQVD